MISLDGGISLGGAASAVLSAVKTADEDVNNSEAFQNDDDLFLPLTAGRWVWEMLFIVTAVAATAGMKFDWLYAGTQLDLNYYLSHTDNMSVTGVHNNTGNNTGEHFISVDSAPLEGVIQIAGSIEVSDAAVLNFRWAQNAAQAFNTTIMANSYIRAALL